MLYLFLSIISSALIGNLLILFSKDKRSSILNIFLGNYFLASAFSFISNDTTISQVRPFDIIIGITTGFLFLFNFIIYQRNIKENGLSLSVSAMRFSLLVPILVSILFFKQYVNPLNYLGSGFILFSFAIMKGSGSVKNLIWLFILFLITGLSETCIKLYDEYGLARQGFFILMLFGSAFIFNLGLLFYKKVKFHYISFAYGMILGFPNQLTTKFFLLSLKSVPAPIAYPLMAACVVLICFLADITIWKRKFNLISYLAYLGIIIGVIFLNLR